MKKRHIVYSVFTLFAMMGCAAPDIAPVASMPGPPIEWEVIVEEVIGCPDLTGEYVLTPKVATLQQNGTWRLSTGRWFEFALLIPLEQVGVDTPKVYISLLTSLL